MHRQLLLLCYLPPVLSNWTISCKWTSVNVWTCHSVGLLVVDSSMTILALETPVSYWSTETTEDWLLQENCKIPLPAWRGWANWKLILSEGAPAPAPFFHPVELLKWNGNRKQICRNPKPNDATRRTRWTNKEWEEKKRSSAAAAW